MAKQKSLLMSYMRKKQRGEINALFVLFIFVVLVMALTSTNVATATNSQQYPSTGLVTGESSVYIAIWLLAMLFLAPVELALRKTK